MAKTAVPVMAVRAIEINSESAASLTKLLTVHNFQLAPPSIVS